MVVLDRCVAALAAYFPTKPAGCERVCGRLRARGMLRLLVAGVMAMSVRLWAQGPVDGAIRGHISAVCGAYSRRCAADEVRVHLTSPDRGVERDVDADSAGDFLLLRLPPGEYELRATSRAEGGQDIEGIAVARLDLEGGDLDEVTLTLGAPRLNAQAAVPGLSLAGFGGDRTIRRRLIWRNNWTRCRWSHGSGRTWWSWTRRRVGRLRRRRRL